MLKLNICYYYPIEFNNVGDPLSIDLSARYREDPVGVQNLLTKSEVKIVESCTTTASRLGQKTIRVRSLQVGSDTYHSIDALAHAILKKREKTAADIQILHKLSVLYGSLEQTSNASKTYRVLVSKLRHVEKGFSNIYKNDPKGAVKLLKEAKEVRIEEHKDESASWIGGKTTRVSRHIFIDSVDYGPVDEFSSYLLNKENITFEDFEMSSRLSDLYKSLDQELSNQLGQIVFEENFLSMYENNSKAALDLIGKYEDIRIVEREAVSTPGNIEVSRRLLIRGEDFGPIDTLARHILDKRVKTGYDIEIARKLSTLYQTLDQSFDYTPITENYHLLRGERRELSRGLQQIVYTDFISLLEKGRKYEMKLYGEEADAAFKAACQQTAQNATETMRIPKRNQENEVIQQEVTVRKEYTDSIERGFREQVFSIVDQENLSQDLLGPTVLADIKSKKREILTIHQQIQQRLEESQKIDEKMEGVDVRVFQLVREYESIEAQIRTIQDTTDVDQKEVLLADLNRNKEQIQIELNGSLKDSYELFLQCKKEIEDNDLELERMRSDLEIKKSLFYRELAKVFLTDLYDKLGPENEVFIPEILMFLEQTMAGWLLTKINALLPHRQCVPKYSNPERTITIYPGHVELELVLDCSQEYMKMDEDIERTVEPLPFGIRETLKLVISHDPDKPGKSIISRVEISAQKLEDAPRSVKHSQRYPILVPSLKSSASDLSLSEGRTTPEPMSDSSSSRGVSPAIASFEGDKVEDGP